MKYIRKHLQRNLIEADIMGIQYNMVGDNKTNLISQGRDFHGYFPEVFENVDTVSFTWKDHTMAYNDNNTDEIIESSSYTTVISKDRKTISCMRFEDISGFVITLKESLKNG